MTLGRFAFGEPEADSSSKLTGGLSARPKDGGLSAYGENLVF
jgi:hypothetical protein